MDGALQKLCFLCVLEIQHGRQGQIIVQIGLTFKALLVTKHQPIELICCMNDHWMNLYKSYVFCAEIQDGHHQQT